MWYSAVNLGYANAAVGRAMREQMERLPQLACQYLHREKIELAELICESIERAFGMRGRGHFNVGGSQAIEDALKLVRKVTGRQRMLAFQGGYHGRTLGASAITSSYRYREAFGEFADRAEFIAFPYAFRSPYSGDAKKTEDSCIAEFERLFEHEYTGAWNPKTGRAEFGAFFVEAVQGTGGYVIPPKSYFRRLAALCKKHGIPKSAKSTVSASRCGWRCAKPTASRRAGAWRTACSGSGSNTICRSAREPSGWCSTSAAITRT